MKIQLKLLYLNSVMAHIFPFFLMIRLNVPPPPPPLVTLSPIYISCCAATNWASLKSSSAIAVAASLAGELKIASLAREPMETAS